MSQNFHDLKDTIAAIATAPGRGGIGIIRLSGPQALAIAEKIFLPSRKGCKLSAVRNFSVHHGWVVKSLSGSESREVVDEVLVTVMRAPKSYTTEDVVEISAHGGPVALKAILSHVLDRGARLAEPGEFTKRAFLNGRIDLAQAEAVLDVIESKTEAFLRVSSNQLKGELSVRLEALRAQLMDIYTEIEAVVNFPEDELNAQGKEALLHSLKRVLAEVNKLADSGEQGKILREGIRIVLCGRPNVGKSSLLNALLRQPRAIVTDIAGTTRDTIEETAQIRGVPVQLVDTAGILEPRDLVEEEAIRRSRMSIESADIVLCVLDATAKLSAEDKDIIAQLKGRNAFAVINKCDLRAALVANDVGEYFSAERIIKVSAIEGAGLGELEEAIIKEIWHGRAEPSCDVLVTNIRHVQVLKECSASLLKTQEILEQGVSFEFASEEIKSAVNALDAITGRDIDADLLDKIFSSFCIGK